MTIECIDSFIQSEKGNSNLSIKCILIESNSNYATEGYEYPNYVEVLVPKEKFNFHRFLNIGIQHSQADYYALCNNDIIFEKKWLTEILHVARQNPEINSFSPIDFSSNKLPPSKLSKPASYLLGYESGKHISGWCIVIRHRLLDVIGQLDETFDFYYADDDYGMTLRSNNERHALVISSRAKHLEGVNTKRDNVITSGASGNSTLRTPWYLKLARYAWIVRNEKMLDGHMKFYEKWGDYEILRIKKMLHGIINLFGGSDYLSRALFSRRGFK